MKPSTEAQGAAIHPSPVVLPTYHLVLPTYLNGRQCVCCNGFFLRCGGAAPVGPLARRPLARWPVRPSARRLRRPVRLLTASLWVAAVGQSTRRRAVLMGIAAGMRSASTETAAVQGSGEEGGGTSRARDAVGHVRRVRQGSVFAAACSVRQVRSLPPRWVPDAARRC